MDPRQRTALENFDKLHIGLSKGSLSFALIVTRILKSKKFPVSVDDFVTANEGQVKGLGGGAVRKILKEYGIERTLSDEGGRTSRGNMGRLREYANVLNALSKKNALDLDGAELYWVERIKVYFDSQPFIFRLDPSKSFRFCVRHLMAQAVERQREIKGTMFAGALMQHLVGAKLDILSKSKVKHHGFSVADAPTNRAGDFSIGDVAFHVTTAPTEALIRKCKNNLEGGLRPIVVTTEDGLGGAKALAKQVDLEDRIDVIEIEQFITTNVYEWSQFSREARIISVQELIERYNAIVADCESDPSFRIEFDS
jgi:hypothetical protein